jgi:hypothetical protein
MTDSPVPENGLLYIDEDFFGEHIVATGEDPDRSVPGEAVPEEEVWLEARDEVRIRAGTHLILEAADSIEIRASRVDFVQVPNVGQAPDANTTAAPDQSDNR